MLSKQRGMLSVDLLVGLMIIMSVMAIAWPAMSKYSEAQINKATADQLGQVSDAADRWIKSNQAAVSAAATPLAQYTISTISSELPSGFATVNPYGQSYSIRVYKNAAGALETIVVTTGGDTINNGNSIHIANLIGGQAGYIVSSDTNTLKGVYGGWSESMATYGGSPGTGHVGVATFLSTSDSADQYVYRNAVPGRPELNSMNTPLNMRAQATANTSDSLCVVGDTTTYGRIAADAVGAVLSCQSGIWKTQGGGSWKDPVDKYDATHGTGTTVLPLTGNSLWDVRLVSSLGRAFYWDGTTWKALAVDQNGNLTMTGTMTAGKVMLNDVVVVNTACPNGAADNGLMARDSNGLTLSCQSGSWQKAFGGTGLSGVYRPMAGKTISCSKSGTMGAYNQASASVDANGIVSVRLQYHPPLCGICDTGWVTGQSASCGVLCGMTPDSATATVSIDAGLVSSGTLSCSALWPWN